MIAVGICVVSAGASCFGEEEVRVAEVAVEDAVVGVLGCGVCVFVGEGEEETILSWKFSGGS